MILKTLALVVKIILIKKNTFISVDKPIVFPQVTMK